jgi:hypothetical protein
VSQSRRHSAMDQSPVAYLISLQMTVDSGTFPYRRT